jgi:epoxyqueuosine reductase
MSTLRDIDLSRKIKDFAISIGFDLVGIAPSKQLSNHKDILNKWLSEGMNADMKFLAMDIEKRTDPSLLLDGAKSVVVTGLNYFSSELQGGQGIPVISRYAYGSDYHLVVGKKLDELLDYIVSVNPSVKGKVCVDSSPVLEKAWAREAGLGWVGKNSILINRDKGSFLFLGELILDIELDWDKPYSEDLCDNCRICVDACPTGAINNGRTIDARKCISWLTVENKNEIPGEFRNKLRDRVFGCDICQDVCPWNRNLIPHNNSDLRLSDKIKKMSADNWRSLTAGEFKTLFANSSVKRATYERFMRNVEFVLSGKNSD